MDNGLETSAISGFTHGLKTTEPNRTISPQRMFISNVPGNGSGGTVH